MSKTVLNWTLAFIFLFVGHVMNAQCPPDIIGQNIVVNGDFSQGDTLFSTPYDSWNDPSNAIPCTNPDPTTCPRFWSAPGEYWVHNDADDFNPGSFSSVPSPVSGGNMMMVDAECTPGAIVWEQTVDVTASTNYYFSLWIASIHPQDPAQLVFEVNGVTLGTAVNAPAGVDNWLFYEDTWNSGGLSGPVQLRIRENSGVGCTNGDDFAIDDIQFIPGCAYGFPGPAPYIGGDQTLCGTGGTITLNVGVPDPTNPDYNIIWSTGEITPSINISTPGTYSVCVDSAGGCVRSDVIEIVDTYSINLGPDRNLCSPPTITLDAGYTGPGVTYLWTLNGSPLPGATNQTFVANQAGTYKVIVTDPVCGIQEDEINITSSTITANNAQFCATPSAVNLSINGAGGTYNWYDASTGGSLLQSNSTTYTTPPISATDTFWVEDASTFSYHVGPTSELSGWGRSGNLQDHYLRFNASTSFVLDSVTVYAYNGWNASFDVSVVIADNTGAVIATSTPYTVSGSTNYEAHQIPVGVTVPVGTDLRAYAITTGGGQLHYDGNTHNTSSWPYQVAGIVNIHSNISSGSSAQNSYNHLYDWVISSGAICDRVPVVAVQFCPPACTPPSAATISNPSPVVMCTAGTVTLNANHEPGYEYTWIRNGSVVAGPTVDLFDYVANQVGTYSVRITEAGNPFCFLQSASVEVVEFDISAVDLPPDYSTCNPSQTLDAGVSGTDVTYIWERNAAVIPGANSQTYTIDDLGAYRVWVNHPVCGMATDVVVVSAGTYNINLGADRDLCSPTAYTLDAGFTAAGVTYQWQSPIGTDLTGDTAQTLYVNSPGDYRVIVDHPFCGQQTDDITITSSVATPINDDFCSDDPGDNTADLEVVGPGPYDWYTTSTGGAPVATSTNTYTTPVLTGTTTYYVESTASFKYNKGPADIDAVVDPGSAFPAQTYRSGGGFNGNSGGTNDYLEFDVLTDLTFDSVTVYPLWIGYAASYDLTFEIRDVTGGVYPGTNVAGSPVTYTVNPNPDNCGAGCNSGNPQTPIQVPLGLSLTAGNTYRIYYTGPTQTLKFQPGGGPAIPINTTIFDEATVIDFVDYGAKWGCNCQYMGLFNMVVSSGVPCDRVPVIANDVAPCGLPVDWLTFTAKSRKHDVLLEWSTGSEDNNDYFFVERSADGINWEVIGQVDGAGNAATINHYNYIDQNPLAGVSYYRISQHDYDGSTDYSEVRSVNRDFFYFSVVPNPFNGSTTIVIASQSDTEVDIEVVDVNGKTVFSRRGHATNEPIEFGKDLASGLYIVKVLNDANTHTFKVVKN